MEANHEHKHEPREDIFDEVVDLVKRKFPEEQKRRLEGYAAETLEAMLHPHGVAV